jgi:hypothetical protein
VRDVDIPPHIIPTIEAHLAKHVALGRDSLLFPALSSEQNCSRHLQPSTLYRHWYKARAAAGRKDLRFHDLRHSGAVLAAATGATLAELMARLGHSTPQAAVRYQHAAAGRGREIAARYFRSWPLTTCDLGHSDRLGGWVPPYPRAMRHAPGKLLVEPLTDPPSTPPAMLESITHQHV